MSKTHNKKVIMVTGAGGSIGSELCRRIMLEAPKKLLLVDHCELSLFNIMNDLTELNHDKSVDIHPVLENCSSKKFYERFSLTDLDILYNVAAYKHVPLSEENPLTYYRNNIMATNYCQRIAQDNDAKFVLVSTDKAIDPINVMGKSKRLCEILVLANSNIKGSQDKTSIVRFGNVLNSSGSVIPIFTAQINKNLPITVTHRDAERFFMSITQATSLVVDALRVQSTHDILVLDMGPSINIHSLACNLIEQAGYRVTYENPKEGDRKIEFIGLRAGEKIVEKLSYGAVVETEISGVTSSNEWTNFGKLERDLCLEYANGQRVDNPANFTWEHGFRCKE